MSFTICSNIFETAEFLQVSLKPDNQWLTERGLRGVRLGSVILRLDWVQYDGGRTRGREMMFLIYPQFLLLLLSLSHIFPLL